MTSPRRHRRHKRRGCARQGKRRPARSCRRPDCFPCRCWLSPCSRRPGRYRAGSRAPSAPARWASTCCWPRFDHGSTGYGDQSEHAEAKQRQPIHCRQKRECQDHRGCRQKMATPTRCFGVDPVPLTIVNIGAGTPEMTVQRYGVREAPSAPGSPGPSIA